MSKREPVFLGACTAVVTPFNDQGAVDYDLLGRLVEAQISRGIDALCVCGTTGECATLSLREHMAVVDFCVRRTARRVTVIAGRNDALLRRPGPLGDHHRPGHDR